MPTYGRTAAIGIGEESTWGTPVSRSNWRKVMPGMDLKRDRVLTPREHLLGVSGRAVHATHTEESDGVSGGFEVEVQYRGMGILLKHLLGNLATTGPGGSSEYTHTYTINEDQPEGLTLEVIKSQQSGNWTEVFQGCLITRGEFRHTFGRVGTARFDIMGQSSAARTGTGTPSYVAPDSPVKAHQAGTLSFDSATYNVREFSLTIDRGLSRRDFLGDLNSARHAQENPITITARAVVELGSNDLYTKQLADTQGDAVLAFTGSGVNSLQYTLQNGLLAPVGDPVAAHGVILQTVEWRAYDDGTNMGVEIVNVNLDSSGIAN